MFMRSPATGFNGPARNIAICLLHPLKPLAKYATTDRWPSGRRRTPGKCVGGEPSPGFESLSIRHKTYQEFVFISFLLACCAELPKKPPT